MLLFLRNFEIFGFGGERCEFASAALKEFAEELNKL